MAKRNDTRLGYAAYFGLKKSSGQLHAHILCDYLPDAVSEPLQEYEYHHVSQWLSDTLSEYGLECFILELPNYKDIVHMSEYTSNNTRSLLRSDLPARFRSVRHARHWHKLKRAPGTMHIFACEQCKQTSWCTWAHAPSKCAHCGSESHTHVFAVKGYSNIVLYSDKWREYINTPNNSDKHLIETKTCSKCNSQYPATSQYFQKHGKSTLRSECKQCASTYEHKRGQQIHRRFRRDKMTDRQWFSHLASRGIKHEDMPDDMPIQNALFDDKQEV
jgi:hypothetical protein